MTNPNLTCETFEPQLPDYLEGTLSDSAAADAELHLAACAACRGLADDLREISRQAAALPALAPSRDLWPAIESRIQGQVVQLNPRAGAPLISTRWRLAGIAAGLVAITAITTYQLARRPGSAGDPSRNVVAQTPTARSTTPESVAAPAAPLTDPTVATPVAAATERAPRPAIAVTLSEEIRRLRDVLDERSEELDPRTIAILRSSLATIDTAISDAQGALARDPANRFLTQQLDRSLERKLGLLRRAALLSPST